VLQFSLQPNLTLVIPKPNPIQYIGFVLLLIHKANKPKKKKKKKQPNPPDTKKKKKLTTNKIKNAQ